MLLFPILGLLGGVPLLEGAAGPVTETRPERPVRETVAADPTPPPPAREKRPTRKASVG